MTIVGYVVVVIAAIGCVCSYDEFKNCCYDEFNLLIEMFPNISSSSRSKIDESARIARTYLILLTVVTGGIVFDYIFHYLVIESLYQKYKKEAIEAIAIGIVWKFDEFC